MYNARPTDKTNKELNKWISHQIQNFKKKEHIMKNEEIFSLWNEFINDARYKKYFLSNEEEWTNKLEELKQFIDTNNARPHHIKNKELSQWLSTQMQNFKNKGQIMKVDEIYSLWNDFINHARYKKYFVSNEEEWTNKLEEVKKFIDTNNARPTDKSNKIMCQWISTQFNSYKKRISIMKNTEIYLLWNNFINDTRYNKYFLSNEDTWKNKLEEVKQFIDNNNSRPTRKNNTDLRNWISTQLKNYKNKEQIMKNDEIYTLWTKFIADPKYSKYFI